MFNRFWPGAAVACLVPGACTSDAAQVVAPIAETAPYAAVQARNAVTDTLTDREILEVFYHATGGPEWDFQDGWMSEPSIEDWEGVGVDTAGRVRPGKRSWRPQSWRTATSSSRASLKATTP